MKYLFIGLGSIGLRHLQNLRSLTKEPIYALRTKVNKELDKKYNITSMESLKEAMDLKPDVVFITNPTSKHLQYAMMFCDSHLFIEKPFSTSSEGLEALLSTMEKSNKICFVGYNYRFHPQLIEIKKYLKDIGKLYYSRIELAYYLPNWHLKEDYRKSYSARKDLGGGALLTLSHAIDTAYWLFGDMQVLCSQMSKVSSLDIDVDDIVSIVMQTKDKTIIEVHLDYLQPFYTHNIKIVGSVDEEEFKVKRSLRDLSFMNELRHFLNCVNGKEKPKITHEDIKSVMRIIDEVKKENCISNRHSC